MFRFPSLTLIICLLYSITTCNLPTVFFLSLPQASDGSYTGFIKVHLRLSRPVTVPDVEPSGPDGAPRPTANCNQASSECQEGSGCGPSEKRTSFYLPCDCVKQIHISSMTTTREVIQGLLKKFMVLDNPRKFALYRQTHRDSQSKKNTPNYYKATITTVLSHSYYDIVTYPSLVGVIENLLLTHHCNYSTHFFLFFLVFFS